MKDNYMIDLDSLTEEERQQITAVLKKDEELKHAQDAKINELKTSINAIRMNAVLKPGEDESKICKRCREPFGYFFNTGDFCSTCKCKVCKKCREFIASSQWMCVLCYKQRQLKGLTGEWIVPLRERNENEEPVSVPELVRKSLRKKSNEEKDPHSNYGSSGSSSPTELRFPGESDVHMLSALLAQNNIHTSEEPGDQNIVVKVENKRYVDSDTDDDDVTVSNGPNSSTTLHGSISALSTGRQSSSDQEDATRDGNGFHFDDSAYRPHSDLPDLDELRQKYKSHHSPLSSMTSSPTPSTIGQRLMDLASSVENSDAEDDLQGNYSDPDMEDFPTYLNDTLNNATKQYHEELQGKNVPDEVPPDDDPDTSNEELSNLDGGTDTVNNDDNILIEYHDVSDISDGLSVISENTEPSDDVDSDFESLYKTLEAEEEKLSKQKISDSELDSVISEMSEHFDSKGYDVVEEEVSDAESGSTLVDANERRVVDWLEESADNTLLANKSIVEKHEPQEETLSSPPSTPFVDSFDKEMSFFANPSMSKVPPVLQRPSGPNDTDMQAERFQSASTTKLIKEYTLPSRQPPEAKEKELKDTEQKNYHSNQIKPVKAEKQETQPHVNAKLIDKELKEKETNSQKKIKQQKINKKQPMKSNSESKEKLETKQISKVNAHNKADEKPEQSAKKKPEIELSDDISNSQELNENQSPVKIESFADEMNFFCGPVQTLESLPEEPVLKRQPSSEDDSSYHRDIAILDKKPKSLNVSVNNPDKASIGEWERETLNDSKKVHRMNSRELAELSVEEEKLIQRLLSDLDIPDSEESEQEVVSGHVEKFEDNISLQEKVLTSEPDIEDKIMNFPDVKSLERDAFDRNMNEKRTVTNNLQNQGAHQKDFVQEENKLFENTVMETEQSEAGELISKDISKEIKFSDGNVQGSPYLEETLDEEKISTENALSKLEDGHAMQGYPQSLNLQPSSHVNKTKDKFIKDGEDENDSVFIESADSSNLRKPVSPEIKLDIIDNISNLHDSPYTQDRDIDAQSQSDSVESLADSVAMSNKADSLAENSDSMTSEDVSLPDRSDSLPSKVDPVPDNSDSLPSKTDPLPDNSDSLPSKTDPLPDNSDSLPSKADPLPDNSDSLPSKADPLPDNSDSLPSKTDPLPDNSDSLPSKADPLPDNSDSLPSKADPLPDNSDSLPSKAGHLPGKQTVLLDNSDSFGFGVEPISRNSDADFADQSDYLASKTTSFLGSSESLTSKVEPLKDSSKSSAPKTHSIEDTSELSEDKTNSLEDNSELYASKTNSHQDSSESPASKTNSHQDSSESPASKTNSHQDSSESPASKTNSHQDSSESPASKTNSHQDSSESPASKTNSHQDSSESPASKTNSHQDSSESPASKTNSHQDNSESPITKAHPLPTLAYQDNSKENNLESPESNSSSLEIKKMSLTKQDNVTEHNETRDQSFEIQDNSKESAENIESKDRTESQENVTPVNVVKYKERASILKNTQNDFSDRSPLNALDGNANKEHKKQSSDESSRIPAPRIKSARKKQKVKFVDGIHEIQEQQKSKGVSEQPISNDDPASGPQKPPRKSRNRPSNMSDLQGSFSAETPRTSTPKKDRSNIEESLANIMSKSSMKAKQRNDSLMEMRNKILGNSSAVDNSKKEDTIFFSNCNNDLDKLSMTYGAEATPFSGRIACKLRPKSASQSSADSEVNPKCQSVQFQREFYQLSYGSCSSAPSSSPDRSSTPVNLSGRSSPFSPSPEAVDNTDISSIQSDSGNVTPASNDDINSQGHSKSPSEISSPSITISPAEEEEEEDHLSDDTSSIQQNTYQKTFGGLFSALGGSRESIASYYSQTGGGSYGVVEVKGAIQFAVDYNHKAGVLEIIVKQASELAAVDKKKGTSNPYVKTYLLPDRTDSGKRKTHFKKNCLDPVFNETLKYLVTKSELSNRTLWLSVWNHTVLGKAVFLGEVTLPLTYFTYSSLPQWYTLQDRNEVDPSFVTYKGELSLSVKYIPLENMADTEEKSGKKKVKVKAKEGQLCVLIKKAKNLTPVHSNGSSNPFCKGYFLPQVSKGSKQKTETMKHNLNPSWNYLLTYDNVSYEELANRCMEITVWDQDRFAHNTFLGGVRLSLGTGQSNGKDVTWMNSNEEEISVWASIIEKPNTWVNATLTLRDQMD